MTETDSEYAYMDTPPIVQLFNRNAKRYRRKANGDWVYFDKVPANFGMVWVPGKNSLSLAFEDIHKIETMGKS